MSGDRPVVSLGVEGMHRLVDVLRAADFEVLAPVVSDEALVVRPIQSFGDLPRGVGMTSIPGSARLTRRGDAARFGCALPAQSWKPVVHPPRTRTMTMAHSSPDGAVVVSVTPRDAVRRALLGVRPCELAALDRFDTVLIDRPPSPEPVYAARRADTFVIAVNCGAPSATCFCTAMDTGPHVDGRSARHDLEVTELAPPGRPGADPRYVIAAISDAGADLLAGVAASVATPDDLHAVHAARDRAMHAVDRAVGVGEADEMADVTLDHPVVAEVLRGAHDDARWQEIADRCVACGNCTAVCPTCFCTRIDDVGDLDGTHVERWRTWESCFSLEFSRLGDHAVRHSLAARYRQWMTHKLSAWHDQYGESGCVGCGRCTTWGPAGIDFAAEARRFVHDEARPVVHDEVQDELQDEVIVP